MRLNRYLASTGITSRRGADALIASGRVTVNGDVAVVGQVTGEQDHILLDGQSVEAPTTLRYIAVHKPAGYVSSRRQQGSSPVIYALLPTELVNLRLAGRLDRDSSGLVLLSNDGDFIQAMSHPSEDKRKIYEVDVDRLPRDQDLQRLEHGIVLEDGLSRIHVADVRAKTLVLELEEGRNRQIRRSLGALGYGITRLHRIQIGAYALGALAPGAWQEITP